MLRVSRWAAVVTTVLTMLVTTLGTTVPASAEGAAALAAPSGLTADGGVPRLAWDRVRGATSYDVQVSRSDAFPTPLVWSRSTVNAQSVPDVPLPEGDLFWRVRAKEGSTAGEWAVGTVRVGDAPVPSRVGPADGSVVSQPDSPPLLQWTAVAGAQGYQLDVALDERFASGITTYRPQGTSWVVSAPQLAGSTYYWRVRADLGSDVRTGWSGTGSYRVRGLDSPRLVSPPDDAFGTSIDDVVLDWEKVAGAESYDVRVGTDEAFADPTETVATATTFATQWSPSETLGNDQFYWQVRPTDALGTDTPWEDVDTWAFRRGWPDQPELLHPIDGGVVGDPLFLEWSPVRLASGYRVSISTRPDFPADSRTTKTCTSEATTVVVGQLGCLLPAGATTYFWRVQGVDDPAGVVTDVLSAEVHSFTYRPDRATPTAPENGATVTVPTLRWSPAQGASEYEVTITSTANGATTSADVATTSFTPRSTLVPGTYRWEVRTIDANDRVGVGVAPESQHVFTVAEAPTATERTPRPLDPVLEPTNRFPTLRWTPVAGADGYLLRLRASTSETYQVKSTRFAYPAGELTGTADLVTGTWFWSVEAYSGNTLLSVGPEARFSIAPSTDLTGHRAGLTGIATGTERTCDMGLPNRCQDLDQTPVVRWDPVPGASVYRLQVTFDRERTSTLPSPLAGEVLLTQPMWAHSKLLPESQAGAAYFVSVRACKTPSILTCEPARHANHAVNKRSAPVQLTSPADGGEPLSDDITFSWRDYLDTNQDPALTPDVTGARATLGARQYQIEVSSDPTFTNTSRAVRFVNATVDQTTYTADELTLPEGDSYWRVRAIDGSQNGLAWSTPRRVEKRSPVPVPLTPAAATTVDGGQPFRWAALPFAAEYDVQVFRPGAATPVASGRVAQTAFTPAKPLPAGTGYTWQVRRVDASGRTGEWSSPVGFDVGGATPRLTSPAADADLAPSGSYFTWQPEPGASRYRFQRRVVGSSATTAENQLTNATAYAPSAVLAAGRQEWRVVAVDATGTDLGASDWRAFSVRSAPTAAAPSITGSLRAGNILRLADPVWSMPVDTESVQWYRGSTSTPIAGATARQYETTVADVGKSIFAVVSATREGWADARAESQRVTVTAGDAPRLLAELRLGGNGAVGTDLSVGPVSWDMPDVTTSYQWLRDGATIRGATTASYTVVAGDVGKALALRVTGKRTGYEDAVVTTSPLTAKPGDAPRATTPPGVTGSTAVGSTMSASSGTWSAPGLRFAYQWLRDGATISGATGTTYRTTSADAGRGLSVRVTATGTGYAPGVATSASRTVGKLASATSATLSRTSVRRNQAVQVSVRVTASGATPSGAVALLVNGRQVTTSQLRSGRTTLRYVPRATGKPRLVVRYVGQGAVAASSSKGLVLTVKR